MLSVVFPVYNPTQNHVEMSQHGWNMLHAALALKDTQWIVVNNGGLVDETQRAFKPLTTLYYESPVGLRYSGAVNVGLRMASKDYVIVTSTDVEWITPGWDDILLGLMKTLDNVGSIGIGYYGRDQPGSWVKPSRDWACVAIWAMPMHVVRKVGLLDTEYQIYFDDVDYCYRIEQAGYTLYHTGMVMAVHQGGATIHTDPQHQEKYQRSRQRFLSKWGIDGESWKKAGPHG